MSYLCQHGFALQTENAAQVSDNIRVKAGYLCKVITKLYRWDDVCQICLKEDANIRKYDSISCLPI